jgi:putative copper resistance protein D
MYMQGLANFIDDFLGGLILISYALVVGSMLWSAFILKIWSPGFSAHESVVRRGVSLLRAGAVALAVTQGLKLIIKAVVLASVLGEFPADAYYGTVQFQAGLIRFLLSLGLIYIASQLLRTPDQRFSWNLAALLMIPMVISGAWLVHGVGRFENREQLMVMTVLHQFAAAVWFGGVAQLLSLWHMSRQSHEAKALWPIAITRFGFLGVSSVVLLLLTGLPLAWTYVGSWDGLFGTGYGSLVLTKVILLAVALGFAYLNHQAGQLWLKQRRSETLDQKVPHYIEAESFILVGVLFLAATLSSQPPSVDIEELSATVSEVAEMFAPRMPRLTSPTHEQLLAGEPGRVAVVDKIPSPAATEWSDYNHNVSGLFLSLMGLTAMLSYNRRLRWARYWPVGFIGLSIFLFFRSDAETWPLGPIGFWESTFGNGEVFQHRIATLLAFVLGVLEMRARTNREADRLRYLFPVLCAFGGILLLTHAHAEFELKSEYLIQSTHTAMGLLAVIMASGRWLELRLADTDENYHGLLEGRIAGFVSILAMFLIGLILLVYREPLF